MKAIGIIGYKKSGKTTLAVALAKALKIRGYRIAMVKHTNEPLDHGHSDSGQFIENSSQVAVISPKNVSIILGDSHLKNAYSFFSADFLIIEGFKKAKNYPKIICLRNKDEETELSDGLELFKAGMNDSLKDKKAVDYLITSNTDIEEMVNQIEKKGFLLPDINCGECGYQNCYGLAKAIVKGVASEKDCIYSKNNISITVNKRKIFLNSFLSQLYKNIIYGMLSSLKDVNSLNQAKIEIELKMEKNSKEAIEQH